MSPAASIRATTSAAPGSVLPLSVVKPGISARFQVRPQSLLMAYPQPRATPSGICPSMKAATMRLESK